MESAKKIKVSFDKDNKMKVTRRAEIVIRFDVPEEEANLEYIYAMAAVIKINLMKPLGKSAEVTGKWL